MNPKPTVFGLLLLSALFSCEKKSAPDAERIPDISIQISGKEIVSGEGYDFGSVELDTEREVIVSLRNTGSADLRLTGNTPVSLGGADAAQFAVRSQPRNRMDKELAELFEEYAAPLLKVVAGFAPALGRVVPVAMNVPSETVIHKVQTTFAK